MASRRLEIELIGDPASAQRAFAQVGTSASLLERKFGTVGAAANRVGTQMASLARRAALPAAAIGALSVKSFVDFDRAMTKSLAIMDDVSSAMREDMSNAAREVGKQTQFSATEAADAYFFLASAGLDAQQSLKAMPQVAKFATAGNFDLATATDLVTDAQSALGLTVEKTQKNMKNMAQVSDVLTKANTLANATIQQFSEALTNKGAAALKVLNKDVEEGTAVLAAYADQGVKGAEAGTALSIVLRDLQKAAIANEQAFEDAGIAVFDADGEMRNIGQIVGELEDRFEGMSDKQKKAELSTLGFQEKSQQFLLTLLGTSDSIKEYEKELRNATGTTDRVAKKSMEGFAGSVERLKGQVADAGLEIGERLAPTLQELAEILGDDQIAAEEKFSKALDLIVGKLEELAPKAAAAGAKVGLRLAEGIVKSFSEASPLGKLFIGASVIRIFGGRGAIIASGAAVGKFLGIGVAAGAATGMGGGAAAGAAGGAAAGAAGAGIGAKAAKVLKNVKWARVGGFTAGIAIAGSVLEGFEKEAALKSEDVFERVFSGLDQMKPGGPGGLIEKVFGASDATENERTLRPVVEHLRRVIEMGRQLPVTKYREFSETIAATQMSPELERDLRELLKLSGGAEAERLANFAERVQTSFSAGFDLSEIRQQTQSNWRTIVANFGKGSDEAKDLARKNFFAARDAIEDSMDRGVISVKRGEREINRLMERFDVKPMTSGFEDMEESAKKHFHGVEKAGKKHFSNTRNSVTSITGKMAVDTAGNYGSMASTSLNAIAALSRETNKTLKALGVNKTIYTAKSSVGKAIGAVTKRQEGGPLKIEGSATGDVVAGLFPQGTFILNREAAAAMGFQGGGLVPAMVEPGEVAFPPGMTAAAEVLNDLIPRHQKGGFPELQPPARALANMLAGKGFFPSSTYRASSTTHHGRGEAMDYGDATNNLRRLWPILRPQTDKLAELFGPSYLPSPTLFKHGRPFSSSGLQSTHEDHIHVAITGAIGKLGAAVSMALDKIRLDGPSGPLKDLGQRAIDRVHRAASRHIDSQMAASSDAHPGMSGTTAGDANVERIAAKVAKRLSGSKTATLAAGMAGYAESGMRNLSHGHSSSTGALQLLSSTAASMGINPMDVAAVFSAFFTRGFYRYGSANKSAAEGHPAHMVAQRTQGSAFASGSNYAAQRGRAQAWMQRHGLRAGGYVGLQGGGSTGGTPAPSKGGGVNLGKLGAESMLDLISILQGQAEATEDVGDDVAALTAVLGILAEQATQTEAELGKLSEGPLLSQRDRRKIIKEAEERAKQRAEDRDLSDREERKLERKLRRKMSERARKEERRDRREERADLISHMASIQSEIRSTYSDIADKLRDQLEETIDETNEAVLDAFDKETARLLENLPGSAELEALRGEQESVIETRERAEFERQLDRARRSGSARLIAEAEHELAVFERTQRIEELEAEQAAAQKSIESDRAEERERLEEELQAKKEARLEAETQAQQAALEQQMAAITEHLDLAAGKYADFAAYIKAIYAAIGQDVALPELPSFSDDGKEGGKGKGKKNRMHGGLVPPEGEIARVGEEGIEDVFLPGHARVAPHREVRGGDTVINIGEIRGAVADDPHRLANDIAFQITSRRRLARVA